MWLAVALCAALPASVAQAGDRRHVEEPAPPTQICATLLAAPGPVASSTPAAGIMVSDHDRLQAAINTCPAGQAVHLLADNNSRRFVSGPLEMKSGVTLWLDQGVVLAASADPQAYDRGNGRCGTLDEKGNACRPFIQFGRTKGGGIIGPGAIDGQGGATMSGLSESWWQLARRAQLEHLRQNVPRLIAIDHADDITFYRLTLRNAANFHVAMNQVHGATFWGIVIDTPADARNTDGIDPGASEDVTITHSFIRTGDDNIAIKAGNNGATRHISILDNHFYWGHGMSIGSETNGGVSDVLVQTLTLDGTTSGLRIKSDPSRGGEVADVRYEDICLRNNRRPLDIDTHYENHTQGNLIPFYRHIVLRNVYGDGGQLLLHGYDDVHPVDVTLDNVRFDPAARWQVSYAHVSAAQDGVSPPLNGLATQAGSRSGAACAQQWRSFPEAGF